MRATAEAIAKVPDVVYQAVFSHNGWRGLADFLERQPDGSYEAVDTKLARHARAGHLIQLCFYTEQLERITGAAADGVPATRSREVIAPPASLGTSRSSCRRR